MNDSMVHSMYTAKIMAKLNNRVGTQLRSPVSQKYITQEVLSLS